MVVSINRVRLAAKINDRRKTLVVNIDKRREYSVIEYLSNNSNQYFNYTIPQHFLKARESNVSFLLRPDFLLSIKM